MQLPTGLMWLWVSAEPHRWLSQYLAVRFSLFFINFPDTGAESVWDVVERGITAMKVHLKILQESRDTSVSTRTKSVSYVVDSCHEKPKLFWDQSEARPSISINLPNKVCERETEVRNVPKWVDSLIPDFKHSTIYFTVSETSSCLSFRKPTLWTT